MRIYVFYNKVEIFKKDNHIDYGPIIDKADIIISCKDRISVLLDNGSFIVGDLDPEEYIDAYVNNLDLKEDWEIILG